MTIEQPKQPRLQSFASLGWYDEIIKFIFSFVTKTSELLLAAGIIVSTTNFLTDGDVLHAHKALSDAWAWAQALAIDSSLGIVFISALQAVKDRDRIKAVIFFLLTALLASVAGLITHFDALAHAAGLPVTDKGVSGVIPLWVMTALRAVAVIGFLLTSRLKHISFQELRQQPAKPSQPSPEPVAPQIDYDALAAALVGAMHRTGTTAPILVTEEGRSTALPEPVPGACGSQVAEPASRREPATREQIPSFHPSGSSADTLHEQGGSSAGATPPRSTSIEKYGNQRVHLQEPTKTTAGDQGGEGQQTDQVAVLNDEHGVYELYARPHLVVVPATRSNTPTATTIKITQAYAALVQERAVQHNSKPISARELAQRATVRRATCSQWLQNAMNGASVLSRSTTDQQTGEETQP